MAYSNQRVVSDGTLTLLMLSLNYLDRTEISGLFDGLTDDTKWSWVGVSDKSIAFDPAVPNGVAVTVQRTTDIAKIWNYFGGGAAFNYQSMDTNFEQILHIAQEAREVSQVAEIFNHLNMHGNRIRNVADGVDDADAANMRQMNTVVAGINAIKSEVDAVYDSFDDRYLGAKASEPAVDNDGNALLDGAMYWNTVQAKMYVWSGVGFSWGLLGGGAGATGATGNPVFWENDQHITASYTLTAGKNAGTFGPIIIDPGVTVTIPNGVTWKII